jgi:hypothetical protein
MKSIFLMAILFTSTGCLSQNYFDTLVFNFVDSIWKTSVVRGAPILHLDSSKIDLYRKNSPQNIKELRMKFGYVQDSTGIYVFEMISSDLESLLCDTCQVIQADKYPPHTFFKLNYIFNGSSLKRYNTYEMISGFGREYPLFLESIVDYTYKGFKLPFVVNDEVMYVIYPMP